MFEARAWPASTPPVRQLMTPGGIPACVDNEAMKSVENGFFSLVFITIVLPQARAGATFIANVISKWGVKGADSGADTPGFVECVLHVGP